MLSYRRTPPEFVNTKSQALTPDIQYTLEQPCRMYPSAHGPCSLFATSGHTAVNDSTISVEGARLQMYATAQLTDLILIKKANEMHNFSNLFW